jgi:cytidylate kinase
MSLITISQSMGCGRITIPRLVAKALNLELYDDEKLRREAMKIGIRSEELKAFNEQAPGLFPRLISRKPEIYLDIMEAVLYGVAKLGQGVILGHGSHVLLQSFDCALHVNLYSSIASRVQNLINEHGMTRSAAEKLVEKSDSQIKGFLKYAFHVDWDDPSLYDLIINCTKLDEEAIVNMILEGAKSPSIKECSLKAADVMERMSLEKKMEAAIVKAGLNPAFLHVDVPVKGVVHIRGVLPNQETESLLRSTVNSVSGISESQYDITLMRKDV